ncbi:hypothetical protein [Flavobacterium sp.]|uniref:hypothetical protein n=1 Tax=Flavobacterium sp. TaxID=239 RepID=UPI0025F463E4|nr:hypothetical protein [Flavobacterium sp.]
MKKIIAALTFMLAFSINASAQDKNTPSAYDKGKKEAAELSEFLGLEQIQSDNFARLFEQKIIVLDDKNLSPERRAEFSRVVEAKIRATLDGKQMEKLEKNTVLLEKLTH